MVLDLISNSQKYESMHPLFKQAFDFLKNTDFSQLQPGKIYLDGDNLFVNYAECKTKTVETAKMETHQKYIDIQVAVEKAEVMGYIPAAELKQPMDVYNEAKDIQFFYDKATAMINVAPGQFVIFWPEDGHQPAIAEGTWRKVIIKVKI